MRANTGRVNSEIEWKRRPAAGKPARELLINIKKQPCIPRLKDSGERLMKVVAATGIATYKKAHAVILAGKVVINGKIQRDPTYVVNPHRDTIYVHGSLVTLLPERKYVLYNKLPGEICSLLVPEIGLGKKFECEQDNESIAYQQPLQIVSRLDICSSGLQLLTNDSDWAQVVMKQNSVEQEFLARVNKAPTPEGLRDLRKGDANIKPIHVDVLQNQSNASDSEIRLVVNKGRASDLRHLINHSGIKCFQLKRVRMGALVLPPNLAAGQWINLEEDTVRKITSRQATRSAVINHAQGMVNLVQGRKKFQVSDGSMSR